MSKLGRALGLSRQKARPSHPKADPAAGEAFAKGGLQSELDRIEAEHPGKRLTLWFQDEMRSGQKGGPVAPQTSHPSSGGALAGAQKAEGSRVSTSSKDAMTCSAPASRRLWR